MVDIKQHYEELPYPTRDPEDELTRIISPPSLTLAGIEHAVFGGRRNWSKPFRVLDAGGGTGDATIFLAQQLSRVNANAEVVYIDLSSSSRKIAEERARVRNLTNISFQTGSLLDLSAHTNGTFDFINCCGVIHHLKDPAAGLKTLLNVLRPTGGIHLMVYATLGRVGVYPVQEMLRDLIPSTETVSERIETAKLLLDALPTTNWLHKSPHIGDYRAGDAGIYDLLLHSVDRSYSIIELAGLLSSVGLRITAFAEPALYDPTFWIKNENLARRIELLDPIHKAAFTERLLGFVKKHVVFAVRLENQVVPPGFVPEAVPIWAAECNDLAPNEPLKFDFHLQNTPLSVQFSVTESMIVRLIDGKSSIHKIMETSNLSQTEFNAAFQKVWTILHGVGGIFLLLPK